MEPFNPDGTLSTPAEEFISNVDAIKAFADGEEVFDTPRSNELHTPLADEKPVFITWKKYGFRHIVYGEIDVDDSEDYAGRGLRIKSGHTLCNKGKGRVYGRMGRSWTHISWTKNDPYPDVKRHDEHGTDRPLCGTCRKLWKQETGEELA
jgi:hypothetical protein